MSEMIQVPDGWEVLKLSDIGNIITGNTPSTDVEEYYNGNIPFIGPVDFDGQKYITKTDKTVSEEGLQYSREIPKDTIMTVCIGSTIGKLALSTKQSCTNQQVNSLVCGKKYISEFIYYSMAQFLQRQLDVEAGLQAVPIVNKSSFSNLILLAPKEKKEQEKIAKILSTLDKAIESTNRLIDKEKNIKIALMQELLTNGIDQNGQIRTKTTHTYKPSELGLIPDEWEVDKLNEVTKLMTDFVANGSFESLANNVTVFENPDFAYYVRLVDIRKGLGHEKQTYVDEQSFNFLKKSSLIGKEILIANIGANVGETFLMPIINKPATIAPNMIVVKVNTKIISEFLFYFLTYHKGISELQNVTEGSGQPKINKTKLKTINVLIPEILEQEKIIKILTIQDKKIQTEETNLAKLKELKKGLMNDLLSGKVRVKI